MSSPSNMPPDLSENDTFVSEHHVYRGRARQVPVMCPGEPNAFKIAWTDPPTRSTLADLPVRLSASTISKRRHSLTQPWIDGRPGDLITTWGPSGYRGEASLRLRSTTPVHTSREISQGSEAATQAQDNTSCDFVPDAVKVRMRRAKWSFGVKRGELLPSVWHGLLGNVQSASDGKWQLLELAPAASEDQRALVRGEIWAKKTEHAGVYEVEVCLQSMEP